MNVIEKAWQYRPSKRTVCYCAAGASLCVLSAGGGFVIGAWAIGGKAGVMAATLVVKAKLAAVATSTASFSAPPLAAGTLHGIATATVSTILKSDVGGSA